MAESMKSLKRVPNTRGKESFQRIFSKFGKVDHIYFHKKPKSTVSLVKFPCLHPASEVKGFKVAYVVFSNAAGLKKALQVKPETVLILSTPEHPVLTGIQKWMLTYNDSFIDSKLICEEATKIMSDYDNRQEEQKASETQEPDEEGWVTVASTKRKKPRSDELKIKNHKQKKKKPLVNFYSFQERQTKMEHLSELRKKFDEDKRKIAIMKASRKFCPY